MPVVVSVSSAFAGVLFSLAFACDNAAAGVRMVMSVSSPAGLTATTTSATAAIAGRPSTVAVVARVASLGLPSSVGLVAVLGRRGAAVLPLDSVVAEV